MLGPKSVHASECHSGGFIGANFDIDQDLSKHLYENWRDFNKEFIPVWLKIYPEKSKIAAGLSCGMLWTIAKGIEVGDIILSPDGNGQFFVGEVVSNYYYLPGEILPHRRKVTWYPMTIDKKDMSTALRNSCGSIGTVGDITKYAEEITLLIDGVHKDVITSPDKTIEDPSVFALEKHLEEFLVQNWKHTELGKQFDIYEEEGELVGCQFPCDTGNLDILAISKDRNTLLVVELKKGRVSDSVLGQIQRYMGYIKDEMAEEGQTVKGVIIGLEDDLRIKRALSVTNNIEFYRYKVNFKLFKN